MPRATTKTELQVAAKDQWDRMWKLIDSLPEAHSITFHFSEDPKWKEAHWTRDKNLRDVLIHLYEWHQLLLNWIGANTGGDHRPFLPEPYTWKTYGEMNVGFWQRHQSTSYTEAVEMLRESHSRVMLLMESMSDEELFGKKHFPWTGTTNVGSYCISATSSHYDWAMKKIKRHLKEAEQS